MNFELSEEQKTMFNKFYTKKGELLKDLYNVENKPYSELDEFDDYLDAIRVDDSDKEPEIEEVVSNLKRLAVEVAKYFCMTKGFEYPIKIMEKLFCIL